MQAILKYLATKSGKSVILTVETKTYIFNIFEGFQRYCIEKNVALKYVSAIFIPNKECIPPLCGLYLTLRDMNFKSLKIVCNIEIQILIEKAFSFCPPKDLKLVFLRSYEDEFISVTGQYTLQIKKVRGRFRIEDVPKNIPKQFFKELVSGKRIKVDNEFYNGLDFLEPEINFKKIFLVIDGNFKEIEIGSKVLCFRKKEYSILKNRTEDVWLLEHSKGIDFESQYNLLAGLNRICKDYHLPITQGKSLITQGKTQFRRIGYFKKKFSLSKIFKFFHKTNSITTADLFIYNKETQDFVLQRSERKKCKNSQNPNMQNENSILILGSGCAIPSKYRNVTGILISLFDKVFLFDCGEDSLHQIFRHYGSYKIIDKIDSIFISHSHGDHSLGLVSLIGMIKHKVRVFAPTSILSFVMSFYDNVISVPTDNAKFIEKAFYKGLVSKEKGFLNHNENDVEIKICGVPHNTDSCSISLKYKDIKISFSGDSRPSELFAYISHNSDVLIHECTFDNESKDKALKTSHSTLSEAYEIFKMSESKELLLTHFSQRYPKKFDTKSLGIPCHDFYYYRIGKSKYNEKEINEYLDSLN